MRIILGDLSHITEANQLNLYVPLNVGFLASYIKQRFGNAIEVDIFKGADSLLQDIRTNGADIVGLSAYYWKNELNKKVAQKIKEFSPNTCITVGGPCIDSNPAMQDHYLEKHPYYDALVPNEGEVAFGNLIEASLGGDTTKAIPGVVTRQARGPFINLSTDLEHIPSPYLDDTMKPFLKVGGLFQPMIQTSRLCPYTCAFCVSGKDRGKIRAFEVDRIREELTYIARHFDGPRQMLMYITDDNFGIMPRDLEIADCILKTQKDLGYPNRIYFYNDKRFTQISRDLHEKLGHMCHHGVCLSLQSENPDALKAMNRRNLTDEQLASALAWAKGLNLKTSTELIFGVPGETLESYCKTIDKCSRMKFDVINSYNLILFDGIEMNRPKYRADHQIQTYIRPMALSASLVEGEKITEYEEIVISTKGFSEDDFCNVKKLNYFLRWIYVEVFEPQFFRRLIESGRSLTSFILYFCNKPPQITDSVSRFHAEFAQAVHQAAVTRGLLLNPELYRKFQYYFHESLERALRAYDTERKVKSCLERAPTAQQQS